MPSAPRFYRSCADALTDGFCPQSGLVQRVVCMLPAGSGSGRLYIMKGAMMIKPYNRPAGEGNARFCGFRCLWQRCRRKRSADKRKALLWAG